MENMNNKLNGEAPPVKRKCTPWRKKTLLERYLIIVCVVIFIAFLSMIALVLYLEHVYTRPKVPICNTAVCRAQAGKIMSYMDFDVNPCEDFYNFSCGSFSKIKHPPSHLKRYSSFSIAKENMIRLSKELLESEGASDEPEFIKQVRTYYKACLNLETETANIIEQFLNKTGIYRWPILEHDDYEEEQLVEKTLSIVDINGGTNPYYRMFSGYNYTVYQLNIYVGSPFGNEEMYLNDTDESLIRTKQKYRNLLVYTYFKAGTLLEAIDSEVDELLQFETLFANITNKIEEENSTEITLQMLADECKEIGWKDVIRYTYDYFEHLDDYHDEIPLKISTKSYIDDLCKLFGSTDRRILYNYLVWRFLASHLRRFDIYFEKVYLEMMGLEEFQKVIKSHRCIESFSRNSYRHGLNYLVITHMQAEKEIEEVRKYAKQVTDVMDHMFSVESWLDEKSRNISRKRLANYTAKIGYSKGSVDVGLLEKYFSQINVSGSHIENYLSEERRDKREELFNDTLQMSAEIDIYQPLEVSAYFTGEVYVLTLGVIQLPFYAHGAPKYINYPVLGFVVGHELSHGYDSLDRERFAENSTDVWPDEIVEIFKQKVECYVNQYSQYPLDNNGTMVDGNFTIGDNIADNSGIVQAFTAYKKYVLAETEEPRLPGLDYTNEQMFFISYAQSWCEILNDPIEIFKHDPHSPGRYRVLGPLQNFPKFSEEFNCPIGSPMNPKDKCRMWG